MHGPGRLASVVLVHQGDVLGLLPLPSMVPRDTRGGRTVGVPGERIYHTSDVPRTLREAATRRGRKRSLSWEL